MFGLSLSKIFLTIFVIFAVWYGWRMFARYQALKATRERAVPPAGGRTNESPRASNNARASERAGSAAEDMVECRTCGAFIAASRRVACGRRDCPYPG